MVEATEEMPKWVLWTIVFLILLLAVGLIYIYVRNMSDIERCRLSVIAKAKSTLAGIQPANINLACKTRDITIKEDGAYLDGKRYTKYSGNLEWNIKKTLAEEMATCWYQFLEGKDNPFGGFGAENVCVICSEIRFDSGISSKYNEINGIYDFLNENDYESGLTYSQYIFKDKVETTDIAQNIGTDKDYGVVFSVIKKTEVGETIGIYYGSEFVACLPGAAVGLVVGGPIGAAIGCGAGAIIGGIGSVITMVVKGAPTDHVSALFFAPLTKVRNACDSLG